MGLFQGTAQQVESINMSCAICCLSITRFLTDHIDALPLAVTARILDTYDLLMVLCPLLEVKPWQADGADGTQRRFLQGHWACVPEAEVRKMAKAEAQCWLAVYNLVLTPAVSAQKVAWFSSKPPYQPLDQPLTQLSTSTPKGVTARTFLSIGASALGV